MLHRALHRGREDEGEVVLALPEPVDSIALPTRVRSTLLGSSLRSLRNRNLYEQYLRYLDPAWRDTLLESVAGVWLPIEAGIAHYGACDRLNLLAPEQMAIGRDVGDRLHGTFLGTMIRGAKASGVTPWITLTHAERLYVRLFDGGACGVRKLGPKEAHMELVANPLVRFAYFRNAMRGLWQVALEVFCRRAYLVETGRTDTSYRVRISWA